MTTLCDETFNIGDHVEVVQGRLKGQQGVVVHVTSYYLTIRSVDSVFKVVKFDCSTLKSELDEISALTTSVDEADYLRWKYLESSIDLVIIAIQLSCDDDDILNHKMDVLQLISDRVDALLLDKVH